MGKLIPFDKKIQKQMGWVNTKNGPMVDRSKLVDQKKYQKPVEKESKEAKKVEKKEIKVNRPKVSTEEKQRLEKRGIY